MNHSIVEAKNNLSALIDRVAAGEEVVITRHGRPVARIVPVEGEGPLDGPGLLALLERVRVTPEAPLDVSATALIREMRDEGP